MEDFQRAIDLDPGYVLAYVALAETIRWYVRYRGPEEAEREVLINRAMQALDRALDLDSESAAAISALGLTAGNRVLAIQAFEHALELDPNHAKSYYRLGLTKLRMGEPDEAERLVRKALDLDPLNADWRNDLAGILWELQRDEEALTEVRKSIEIEPKLVWNHHRLSRWESFGRGNLDEAIIHARAAYALDPRNGGIAWEVSGLYTDLGGRAEAIAWMDRSNELRPGNSYTWLSAYMTMAYFGEEDAALEYTDRCLELEPGNPWALRILGFRDIEAGRSEEALDRWQRAYPTITARESQLADDFDFCDALFYAQNLKEAGEIEWAMNLTNGCLDELNRQIEESSIRQWEVDDIAPEILATLGQKNETLEAMRRSIVDGHHRMTPIWYSLPHFDFVRDEPEFQELMDILHADLAEQLKRVREMECNGELAPAPDVEIELVCE
jgi:tetratricopeptide (TPR) repeat protein